jgi:hypothetical protein
LTSGSGFPTAGNVKKNYALSKTKRNGWMKSESPEDGF